MHLKFAIVAVAVLGLTVPAVSDAAAQYRNDRSGNDRHRSRVQPPRAAAPSAQAVRTAPALQQARPQPRTQPASMPAGAPAVAAPPAVAAAKPVAKPVPTPPLTEEQVAAKSAVDELLSRDPVLLAARELPDPRLSRAAAAKHDAEERKAALLRAKRNADDAKRRDLTERKAREDARLAALKARPDAQAKPAKAKNDTIAPRPDANRASVTPVPPVPVGPAMRMPMPEGPPLARGL